MFAYPVLVRQLVRSREEVILDLTLPGGCYGFWHKAFPLALGPGAGSDWVRRLSSEDRALFAWIGLVYSEFGRLGGLARARTAKRDRRGRFV